MPAVPATPSEDLYLGIDFGTGGCRVVAIDRHGVLAAQAETPLSPPQRTDAGYEQDPGLWWQALATALTELQSRLDLKRIRRLAVDGTSATLLLCDTDGEPLAPALMYHDARAGAEAARIAAVAPADAAAHGATGALAKLLWLQQRWGQSGRAVHALHQADWIAGRLTGRYGHSDYNNCLKLGYDAAHLAWPAWLATLGVNPAWLPQVHAPGDSLGPVKSETARKLGLSPDTTVTAGTTDGVAAFLAAGAQAPGEAVTSLGSTLVLKLLSDRPVSSPAHGIYSHRLGRYWLAGGASNSGGAALAQFFSVERLRALTPKLKPDVPTGLDYYPLPTPGERFPVNDPQLAPRLSPRPADDAVFLQALFEGMARIEAQGYALLSKLGAPKLAAVFTTGGGAQNPAWERIRARMLGVPLHRARSDQAAYGAACLAAGLTAAFGLGTGK